MSVLIRQEVTVYYMSTETRTDITYTVSNVAKYCSNLSKQHWTAVKRIMRYLKKTNTTGCCTADLNLRSVLDTQTLIMLET